MKKKYIIIFFIISLLFFLLFFDFGILNSTKINYSLYSYEEASFVEYLLSKYKIDKKNGMVTKIGKNNNIIKITEYSDCSIFDRNNWECREDDMFEFGFNNGKYYNNWNYGEMKLIGLNKSQYYFYKFIYFIRNIF